MRLYPHISFSEMDLQTHAMFDSLPHPVSVLLLHVLAPLLLLTVTLQPYAAGCLPKILGNGGCLTHFTKAFLYILFFKKKLNFFYCSDADRIFDMVAGLHITNSFLFSNLPDSSGMLKFVDLFCSLRALFPGLFWPLSVMETFLSFHTCAYRSWVRSFAFVGGMGSCMYLYYLAGGKFKF